MATPIQIAIQGGGARIVSLIAAAEVFESYRTEHRIAVKRVAGTSAGAIIAALFAARVPMVRLRDILSRIKPEDLRRVFPKIPAWKFAAKLILGQPMWSDSLIRSELSKLLTEAGVERFGDIKKKFGTELIIIASNLTSREAHVYKDDDELVVDRVLDSCAIPFFFRMPGGGGSDDIVDGGICENLPADYLSRSADAGTPLGIAFERTASPPKAAGPFSFVASLLDTAMNNSVLRAQRALDGRVLPIKTSLTTFDFERALAEGFGPSYDIVKNQTNEFLRDQLRSLAIQNPKSDAAKLQQVMKQLHAIYEAQHQPIPFKYHRTVMTIKANCLLQDGDLDYGRADEVTHVVEFAPSKEPLGCYRMKQGWAPAAAYAIETGFSVKNKDGDKVEAVHIPLYTEGAGATTREFLIFFIPPLEPGTDKAPFTLRIVERIYDSMNPLRERGQDHFTARGLRSDGVVDRMDIVLFLPERYKDVKMKDGTGSHPGRPMTTSELSEYPAATGFYTKGWTGAAIPAKTPLRVDVEIPQ